MQIICITLLVQGPYSQMVTVSPCIARFRIAAGDIFGNVCRPEIAASSVHGMAPAAALTVPKVCPITGV